MTVRELRIGERRIDVATLDRDRVPADVAAAIRIGVLASEPRPFDPMEQAFHDLAAQSPSDDTGLVRRYPLSSRLLAVVHVWRGDGGRPTIAIKGAPEAVVGLCRLSPTETVRVMDEAADMAAAGLRVLGLARRGARWRTPSRRPDRTSHPRLSGWSGSPTRFDRACRRRCASATRPACA